MKGMKEFEKGDNIYIKAEYVKRIHIRQSSVELEMEDSYPDNAISYWNPAYFEAALGVKIKEDRNVENDETFNKLLLAYISLVKRVLDSE